MSQPKTTPGRDVAVAADCATENVAAAEAGAGRLPAAHLKPMQGWSLWLTLACLGLGLLLSSLETTIIGTALVSISSSLGGFDKSNWVVTSYLITYTAFLVVWARASDLVGRKTTLIAAQLIFTSFSLACGLSQTMKQLIVFRAFQGLGGAGLYSLAMTVMAEVTPVQHIGVTFGMMSAIFATSSILGTILGGVIANSTTWRWVFYLNLPPGIICLVVVIFVFPVNTGPLPRTWRTLQGIDFLGVATFLGGCIPLVFALESGGVHYSWNSAVVVANLVVGGVCFAAFALWQWYVDQRPPYQNLLPLFPARIVSQRTAGLIILSAFFSGFPFMAMLIFLPQRLQVQNGLSPMQAGIDMLALLLLTATGSGIGGMVSARARVKGMAWYMMAGAIPLQIVGLGLLTTLPDGASAVPARQYGFQVLLGLGFGIAISSQTIAVRLEVNHRDTGVVTSAITQVRVLGGLVGIAIGQSIISSRLSWQVGPVLGREKLGEILTSINRVKQLPAEEAALVRLSYGQANLTMYKAMLGFAVVALASCLAAWKPGFDSMLDAENRHRELQHQESSDGNRSETTTEEKPGLP